LAVTELAHKLILLGDEVQGLCDWEKLATLLPN
jgi:hypothetical protein